MKLARVFEHVCEKETLLLFLNLVKCVLSDINKYWEQSKYNLSKGLYKCINCYFMKLKQHDRHHISLNYLSDISLQSNRWFSLASFKRVWLISTFIGICYILTDAKLFTRVTQPHTRTHTHTCAHTHTHTHTHKHTNTHTRPVLKTHLAPSG